MSFSRTDQSHFASWWFSVDRVLLTALIALLAAGIVLSLAASPAMALKRGFPTFFFFERHVVFALGALGTMLVVSFLSPPAIRRCALALLIVAIAAMAAVLVIGPEINGARRWLRLGGHSLQPSEFAKPAFVVLCAWLLAETERRHDVPATTMAFVLLALFEVLLLLEPDVGQSLLSAIVFGAMFLLAGGSLKLVAALISAGAVAGVMAYQTFPHVRGRIDRFLSPGTGDTFQTDRALQSFTEGGFFGRGPGEGTIKHILPDAHTDFIFAVVAEEYGVLACLVVVGLFMLVVARGLMHALDTRDPFVRLAASGLALLLGVQAMVNMGVNIGLLPAKGMTLPFISNGGSSMLAVGITAGMLLALCRSGERASQVPRTSRVTGPVPHADLPVMKRRMTQ
jgi:cell division protein FtsW